MGEFQIITVPGKFALEELDRRRTQYHSTGIYPIILGNENEYEMILEGMELAESDVPGILAESQEIDVQQWIDRRKSSDPEVYLAPEGVWPGQVADIGIVTHLDIITKKPFANVLIGLIDVKEPWEVFAHLKWGGWNACPFPAEHCAIHRFWASKYGAEVVSVTHDIVQCVIGRIPLDRQESLALARDQYVYCSDIVDQGTGSIASLAAGLLGNKTWYFWWD